MIHNPYPVLYTARNDPSSIRARIGLYAAGMTTELREVTRDAMPDILTDHHVAPPCLVHKDTILHDKSLEIMRWALGQKDPNLWLAADKKEMDVLLAPHEEIFRPLLDDYPDLSSAQYDTLSDLKESAAAYLRTLEAALDKQRYLMGQDIKMPDMAIFPFIYALNKIDPAWFDGLNVPRLHQWITELSNHAIVAAVMGALAPWTKGDTPILMVPWGSK